MRKHLLIACAIASAAFTNSPALAQQNLSPETIFGDLRARHIGPAVMSGRISTLDGVNRKPEIMYIGAAGGGVWKTISGGASFRPVFDDYTQSIGKITIDQQHPDTVWVGTGESWVRNSVSVGTGIYKTTNGGTTWEHMGLENSEHISDIIVSQKYPNTVYVGVQGHLWNANADRGVFKTTDGGKSWSKIFFIDENTGCADLEVDPQNPDVLYAAMWGHRRSPDFFNSGNIGNSGLYKSIDGGKSWNKIQKGMPNEPMGRFAIAVAPTNGNTIYATVEAKSKEGKGLYKSTDAGASWKKVSDEFNTTVRPFYFSEMIVSPASDSTVMKGGLNMIISEDGGKRFRQVDSGVHSDIHAMWVNPQNPNNIIIGTDGGVYESKDGGRLFKMYMNLPVSQFYHVSIDMDEPYNVYGGLQDNGSWYAPNQKAGGITNADWKMTYGGDGFYSFRHPTDPDIIFAEYQGGMLVRYNKKTGVAKDIKPYPKKGEEKFRFNWNAPIHLSSTNPERIYFGSQYLFMSEDRGDSWKHISPDLTTNDKQKQRQAQSGGLNVDNSSAENHTTIYAIAESPLDEKMIWVGTDDGNLQLTTNGGQNWTNVAPNVAALPKGTWVSFVEPGRHDKNVAFATFDGHRTGDMKTYLYKTTDAGKSWKALATPDIEGYALSVRQDLVNPDLLFLGTEFGLYVSIDGGESWGRFTNNMPKVGVHDMVIHPRDNDLVLATHGRGIIIIDDLSPLRQYTKEVEASNMHFFAMEPAILKDAGAGSSWYPGAGNYVGENPNETARIAYFMPKRHTFGKMDIEVYDQEGKLIKKLPAGKKAGINIIEMPTRLPMPKAAPTNNRMSLVGSLYGPNMPAGTYKVKLIKGKESYESSFTLQYDDKAPYTAEGRSLQHNAIMQLYDMTQQLAYIYHELGKFNSQLSQRMEQNKQLTKKLRPYVQESEKLRNSLVSLGGDFYVDEGEQLRERISELFLQISNYPGKPSESQLDRVHVLTQELAEVEKQFQALSTKKIAAVNKQLAQANLDEVKLQTMQEFLDSSENSSSGSGSQLQQGVFSSLFNLR
jgi:photosystem II stability/assembly factor-like uncharacterized protein